MITFPPSGHEPLISGRFGSCSLYLHTRILPHLGFSVLDLPSSHNCALFCTPDHGHAFDSDITKIGNVIYSLNFRYSILQWSQPVFPLILLLLGSQQLLNLTGTYSLWTLRIHTPPLFAYLASFFPYLLPSFPASSDPSVNPYPFLCTYLHPIIPLWVCHTHLAKSQPWLSVTPYLLCTWPTWLGSPGPASALLTMVFSHSRTVTLLKPQTMGFLCSISPDGPPSLPE